jgi:WD40 repeat protein
MGSVSLLAYSSVAVAQSAAARTQPPRAPTPVFTADDALEINTTTIADMSDDGKWLALTQSVRRDSYGNDYRHDGDPTYMHPVPVRVWSVDAQSGQRTAIFPDKKAVRATRWSPDGNQLAMLVWNGDVYEPAVFTRSTGKVSTLKMPAGKYVAETSDIRWNGAGTALIVAVHTTAWRQKAKETFANITAGPVFVQNSKDPFLAWDDLRRMANRRSVGELDAKTGAYKELIPEALISSYTLADDGSVIAYTEDQTKKTDYDGNGNDGRLFARSLATGANRTILPSTNRTQVIWSEDGKRFAYSKDGRVHVGSVGDSATKLVAGPAETPRGTPATPPDTTAAGRAKARAERFTASRFSPHGDALLISNG